MADLDPHEARCVAAFSAQTETNNNSSDEQLKKMALPAACSDFIGSVITDKFVSIKEYGIFWRLQDFFAKEQPKAKMSLKIQGTWGSSMRYIIEPRLEAALKAMHAKNPKVLKHAKLSAYYSFLYDGATSVSIDTVVYTGEQIRDLLVKELNKNLKSFQVSISIDRTGEADETHFKFPGKKGANVYDFYGSLEVVIENAKNELACELGDQKICATLKKDK